MHGRAHYWGVVVENAGQVNVDIGVSLLHAYYRESVHCPGEPRVNWRTVAVRVHMVYVYL